MAGTGRGYQIWPETCSWGSLDAFSYLYRWYISFRSKDMHISKFWFFDDFGDFDDFTQFYQNWSKSPKIHNFQKSISFDLNEIYHRYRYEKASKDPREHVSGHNWFTRPLPAGPGHYEYHAIMPNFTKSSKNPIFSIFQILSGSGRKSAIWGLESVRKR